MTEYAVLLEKLNNIDNKTDRIEEGVKQNDRTLRGHNSDGGMVAKVDLIESAVSRIDGDIIQCKTDILNNKTTLHGDGEDKIGVVGEQQVIKRLNKWLIGIATGVLSAFIINVVLQWLQNMR